MLTIVNEPQKGSLLSNTQLAIYRVLEKKGFRRQQQFYRSMIWNSHPSYGDEKIEMLKIVPNKAILKGGSILEDFEKLK